MSIMSDISQVIPQDIHDQIMDLRDRDSNLSWDYGRVANEVYQYIVANGLQFTKIEACGYISTNVDNDRSAHTIMRYARVQEFFADKENWRRRYEFLPFSHFELAMHCGQDWKKVLNESVKLMAANHGRPPSRRRLEIIFLNGASIPDPYEQKGPVTDWQEVINSSMIPGREFLDKDHIELMELQGIVTLLQKKLERIQIKFPLIATPIGQAVIILNIAMRKIHEQATA